MLRLNIYHNGKLIGQDILKDNGTWVHKWYDSKTGNFERGQWRGRAKGDDELYWIYKIIEID